MNKKIEKLINKIVIKQENDVDISSDLIDLFQEAVKKMPVDTLAQIQWEVDYAKNYVEENICSKASDIPVVRMKDILRALESYLDVIRQSYGTDSFGLCKTIFDVIVFEFSNPIRDLNLEKEYPITKDMFEMLELKTMDEVYAYYKMQIHKCLENPEVMSIEFYLDLTNLIANSYNLDFLR